MRIVAIDPGTRSSGLVHFEDGKVLEAHSEFENKALLDALSGSRWGGDAVYVFEQIENYGANVGKDVFETVFWTGRFYQVAFEYAAVFRMPRKAVKLHLCGSPRAKDSDIRAAILDRFGGAEMAKGRKAAPGPLFGVTSHSFAALALALTFWDERRPGGVQGA